MSYTCKSHNRRPRKYQQGAVACTVDELLRLYRGWLHDQRSAHVWMWNRPVHIAVIGNRPFQQIASMCNAGMIRHAVLTDEYREWVAKEAREAFPSEGPVPMEDAA